MEPSDGDEPSDTMRGRVPGSGLKLWVLLGASRRAVAGALVAASFAAFVILGAADPEPLRSAVADGDPIETLFQAFATAIITGVTLVVTINQVVLSQELGAVGDQRDRMSGSMEFREDVEEALEAPISPPEPAAFLRALIDLSRSRGERLADAVSGGPDGALRERVDDYVDGLAGNADDVSGRLEDAQFGTFDVLFAALDFNYSWKIYEARRLRNEHDGALGGEAREALDGVIEALRLFGLAREHFKTLYFQWELIDLSRAMLYAAIPALIVTGAMILYVDDPNTITGSTVGVDNLVWVASAASAVALVPFMILVAYVLRIATVAKRTLAIGPFVLRETGRSDDIDD